MSVSAPATSCDDSSGSKPADILDDQVRNGESDSPSSVSAPEQQLPDKKESSNPQSLENYADIGLVQDNSPSYAPAESRQSQDPPELQSFSVSLVFRFKKSFEFFTVFFNLWPV